MGIDSKYYIHESDKAALNALKAIPGFSQLIKSFMKIWSERQYRISNMSSCIKINDRQLKKYYDMLPPICEKLGIDIPDLYLELNVNANAYTWGDTKPFIVITSGLLETIPDELIPTVLAHECGHIACHHALYTTLGNLLLGSASSALRSFVPYGSIASMPIEMAFFYWMRCSEFSADRAAVLCDGTPDKMSEVCMRLAGYDKDINALASKEEFMKQAQEYKDMIRNSAWDKTLEFLILSRKSHPLMTVRALECEEWSKTEQYKKLLDNSYLSEEVEQTTNSENEFDETPPTEPSLDKKPKNKLDLSKLWKKPKEEAESAGDIRPEPISIPDEIRMYKDLLDEGIISEEEFTLKKKQLLNI